MFPALPTMATMATAVGISVFRRIADLWRGGVSDSLIDYTQVARVEPIVLIDADCLYLESLPEVQQSLLSIFAGYYLQAVAISANVGKVNVMHHLDKLNPRRNPGDSAANTMGWLLAQESYKDRLPVPGDSRNVALEDINDDRFQFEKDKFHRQFNDVSATDREKIDNDLMKHNANLANAKDSDQKKLDMEWTKYLDTLNDKERNYALALKEFNLKNDSVYGKSETGFGRDTMKDLKELANLSVGKMFSVEITDGLHKASMPVSIRLLASTLPSASLNKILTIGHQDNSMKERFHGWKSGRLEFVRDLICCQDLIDQHRKDLMHDKDGIYTNIIQRNSRNVMSTLLSGNPSVATASNLVIMSNDTVSELELHLDGKFKDFNTREKVFKAGYLMIVAVINKEWDRVTFYHRGLRDTTEVSVRDLKASNKGNGADVGDILSAYRMASAPSL